MSDMDAAVEATAGGRSRKGLVIVIAVVLLLGAGAAVVVPGMLGGGAAEAAAEATEAPAEGAVVPLGPLTASTGGATPGYVRVGIALVLAEGFTAEQVSERFPLVQDAALSALSEYEPDRLRTPEGIGALRSDLGARVRAIYTDGEVLRIVFTELLVQ